MSASEHRDDNGPSNIPHAPQDLELPNEDETTELLQTIEVLRERIEEYRDGASAIDDEFRRQNEDRSFGLDDIPYGEELIRTREFTSQLADAQRMVENIHSGALTEQEVADSFNHASAIAQEVASTLDGCTPLPPSAQDDGDEYDAGAGIDDHGDDDDDDDDDEDEGNLVTWPSGSEAEISRHIRYC